MCYIWSVDLYGAENWTLRKADHKHRKSFNMWCWRRAAKITWIDRVKNEEILHAVKEKRNFLHTIKERKSNWIA
jgi:hypothetical protein